MKHIKIVFFSLFLLSLTTATHSTKQGIRTLNLPNMLFAIADSPRAWHPCYPSAMFICNQPEALTYEQFVVQKEQQRAHKEINDRAAALLAGQNNHGSKYCHHSQSQD